MASFWGEIVKSDQESSLLKGNAVKINIVQMKLLWKYWLMVKPNKIMIEEIEIYDDKRGKWEYKENRHLNIIIPDLRVGI